MQTCRTNETNKCFYLTKENREEFLKEYKTEIYKELNDEYVHIEDYGNYFVVSIKGIFRLTFYYNRWHIEESTDYGYPRFFEYTEEDFNENYELIMN